jgi:hypothetical protein
LDAVIVDGVFVHVVVEQDGAGEVGEAVDVGGPYRAASVPSP